jgi:ribosomal-protein-alanine N-acetyltransferase
MKTPQLETDRLILRTFHENDTEDVFFGWESDPEVAKYMSWSSHNDIEKTKSWIASEMGKIDREDWYRWAIIKKETGELLGTCLIYYEKETSAFEVSYNLCRKYWGNGYITEAMKEAIKFAKEELDIAELKGSHAKINTFSENVLKKLGFTYVCDCTYDCGGKLETEGKTYKLNLSR